MRRFFLFTILILGLVQAQQVQYCLESRMGAGTDTLNLYMQSTSNQVVNVAAVNFSIVFHDSCTQAPGVLLNEFENTWGNFVARRDTAYNQMASYRGVQYDTRWQYANADTNFLAPTFVVLPADTSTRKLVLSLLFTGTCSYDIYMEDVSENPVAQLGSAFFQPIPYSISRVPCDSCIANWAVVIDSANFSASFTNLSITSPGPKQFKWGFGDGALSDSISPQHDYPGPGTYSVSLSFADTGCTDTFIANVTIPGPACETDFSFVAAYNVLDFTGIQNSGYAKSWQWDFGDGESDTTQSPSHRFEVGDQYSVCLATEDSFGCRDTICKNIQVESCNAGFSITPINGAIFQFDGQTDADTAAYFWTLGDSNMASDQSFTHAYSSNGKYKVCLRVINPITGCRDSICDSVDVIITGLNDKPPFTSVSVYPNPSKNETAVFFELEKSDVVEFALYNGFGQKVYAQKTALPAGAQKVDIPLQQLPEGYYWLRLTAGNKGHTVSILKTE